MTTTNRAAVLNKTHRVLKRTYKPSALRGEQPLLESLLFACCLENTHYDVAQEAFTKLRNSFFDWNEIRVSTVKELAEVMGALAEPPAAAARLKGILQSVFESDYSFELEQLKKQNIGTAVKRLQKLSGATPFVVAYGTQTALAGHSIPVDKGTLGVLYVLGVITQSEAEQGNVPGMERAIPKSKGHEFGALVHELGSEFFSNPFSPALRELLLSIAPGAKERFPKRTTKKPAPEPVAVPAVRSGKVVDGKKQHKEQPPIKKVESKSAQKTSARAPKAADGMKKNITATKKAAAKTLGKRKPR